MAVTKQTARSHPKTVAMAKATQPPLQSRVPPKKSTTKSSSTSSSAAAAAPSISSEEISITGEPPSAPKKSTKKKPTVKTTDMKRSPLPRSQRKASKKASAILSTSPDSDNESAAPSRKKKKSTHAPSKSSLVNLKNSPTDKFTPANTGVSTLNEIPTNFRFTHNNAVFAGRLENIDTVQKILGVGVILNQIHLEQGVAPLAADADIVSKADNEVNAYIGDAVTAVQDAMGGDLLEFEGEDGEEPTVIPIAEIVKQFMSRGITLNVSQVPQSLQGSSSHSISHYDALMELGDYCYHEGYSPTKQR